MGLIAHFEWGWCKNPKNPGASISRKQFNDQVVRKSMIKHLLDNVVPETVVDCPTIASAANQDQSTDEIQGHRQGSSALQSQVGGVLLDKPVNIAKLKQPMGSKKSSQSRGGLGAGLALDAIPSLIPTPAASSKAPWSFEAMKRAIDAQYSQNHNASPANEAPIQGTSRHPIVQNAMDLGIEMFSTRFWDPDDKDFSIDIFFNKDTGIYMCPYPTCYNKPKAKEEFVAHLKRPHTLQRVCCPGCYRAFPTCSALIGHCESASEKCRIRHSSMLKEVMDAYSGGILSVKSKPTFRDEQWGDTLKVDSLQNVLEQERQDAASHLRSGNELTLQAQEPQMYW